MPMQHVGVRQSEGSNDLWAGVGNVSCSQEGHLESPTFPRCVSAVPRFGQVTSSDQDVPALPGASCFLP